MARYEILVIAVIMALSIHQASAISCWNCNNLAQAKCDNPFDASKLTDFEKLAHYAECPSNRCVKMSQVTALNNGKPVITRLCAKSDDDATRLCANTDNKKDFECEICSTDGCNSAAQYGPVAALIIIPVAIAKFFAF